MSAMRVEPKMNLHSAMTWMMQTQLGTSFVILRFGLLLNITIPFGSLHADYGVYLLDNVLIKNYKVNRSNLSKVRTTSTNSRGQ